MYLEAKETALLYKLLTEKLGNDTTEAMFKYIDNKTEHSVEATIKTLATKDDIANVRKEISDVSAGLRKELGEIKSEVIAKISETSNSNLKWTLFFWVGQLGAILGIIFLFFKK
jgi:hypothetical protein